MRERYFFDSSAFIAILRKEPGYERIETLLKTIPWSARVTSVLVAYELFRGIPASSGKAKAQIRELDNLLYGFTLKPVHTAHAMTGAKLFRQSKGFNDPILAAQCVDGGFVMVTKNRKDFERVPGIKLADL